MSTGNIISAAMKMFHLTQLNTYVAGNGEIVYRHEKVSVPVFMPGAEDADVLQLFHKMDEINKLHSCTNTWGLNYLGYPFLAQQKKYAVIIGPYLELTPNITHLSVRYGLTANERIRLKDVLETMKILTPEQVNSYETLLQQLESFLETETSPIVIYADEEAKTKPVEKSDVDEEAELVKERYRIEQDFMKAVERGDKQAALNLISSDNMLFSFSERFPNKPLRRLKNLTITLNTLLRTAARNGDVPAILIHQISEKYAFEIENGENVAEIHQLQDRMIAEYCDLVKTSSLQPYSHMVQQAIEHIMSFYDQPIDKKELAAHCRTHPGNLSRKFKRETGMTITEYQQTLRIDQAKHLLKTETLPIDEIAWMVGYDDASYFGRVFKKITGLTPSEYRRDVKG